MADLSLERNALMLAVLAEVMRASILLEQSLFRGINEVPAAAVLAAAVVGVAAIAVWVAVVVIAAVVESTAVSVVEQTESGGLNVALLTNEHRSGEVLILSLQSWEA